MTLDRRAGELVASLRNPLATAAFDSAQWRDVIGAARAANLLGTLAERVFVAGVQVPDGPDRHLSGARQLANRQRLSVCWEAHALQEALGELGSPVVLLKGAAYVMSPTPRGAGRMFGDIDILVPRESLGAVESALMLNGWVSAKSDSYDQRYYREWMHEIPPMVHMRRGTVIDVHHTILPLTARNAPDPALIIARSEPVPGLPLLRVPALEDLLIHSLTHLMHEGELQHGLRDLTDIDAMVRERAADRSFWPRLVALATGNDLAGPVGLGLHLARTIFGTPIPPSAVDTLLTSADARWCRPWLPSMYAHALSLAYGSNKTLTMTAAEAALYLRAHSLRMPPVMLLRHLAVKAWKGLRSRPEASAAP